MNSKIGVKNVCILLKNIEQHVAHNIHVLNIDNRRGIRSIFCVDCRENIVYFFAKDKKWSEKNACQWIENYTKDLVGIYVVENKYAYVDYMKYFGHMKSNGLSTLNKETFYTAPSWCVVLRSDIESHIADIESHIQSYVV